MKFSRARVMRMVRKELRQILRDNRMRGMIFLAPLVQLVVFGYAVSTDVATSTSAPISAWVGVHVCPL